MSMHSHDTITWARYKESLSQLDAWSHCGSVTPHPPHRHDIVINGEEYPNNLCVGTPAYVTYSSSSSLTPPPAQELSVSHSRPSWDDYFLSLLPSLARRSTCDRGRSAAIFVRDNDQIAAGYVGSPPGMPHCDDVGHLWDATHTHCFRTVHAEQNAMIRALRHGISLRNTIVYCTMVPCFTCAKLMVGLGVYRVVVLHRYHDDVLTRELFIDASVALVVMNDTQLYAPCRQDPVTPPGQTARPGDDIDDAIRNHLACPMHRVLFASIERCLGGARVCPHGETWAVQHGILINIDELESGEVANL